MLKQERNKNQLSELLEKVEDMKKGRNDLDLSADEDLSIAIMNLISIEEHLFFSGAKTEDAKYYNMMNEVRNVRKALLKKLIKDYSGEEWCISKHLLASSYRLIEYGSKLQSKGDSDAAYKIFEKAYNLYCLFWYINSGNNRNEEKNKD